MAQDHGPVLRHGHGPGRCDYLGARDFWVWKHDGLEYTDAIWVYWTSDLNRWDPEHKAVVLDSRNCNWSRHIIGLPSVVRVGARLAVLYDGNGAATMPAGVKSHMNRDVGLAWLDLLMVTESLRGRRSPIARRRRVGSWRPCVTTACRTNPRRGRPCRRRS